jgi:hypothetical protein
MADFEAVYKAAEAFYSVINSRIGKATKAKDVSFTALDANALIGSFATAILSDKEDMHGRKEDIFEQVFAAEVKDTPADGDKEIVASAAWLRRAFFFTLTSEGGPLDYDPEWFDAMTKVLLNALAKAANNAREDNFLELFKANIDSHDEGWRDYSSFVRHKDKLKDKSMASDELFESAEELNSAMKRKLCAVIATGDMSKEQAVKNANALMESFASACDKAVVTGDTTKFFEIFKAEVKGTPADGDEEILSEFDCFYFAVNDAVEKYGIDQKQNIAKVKKIVSDFAEASNDAGEGNFLKLFKANIASYLAS